MAGSAELRPAGPHSDRTASALRPEASREQRHADAGPDSTLLRAWDGDVVCEALAVRVTLGAAEFKRVFVRPSHRGKGWASVLLGEAIAWSIRSGAHTAWLETLPGVIDPAIALYQRLGFRPSEMRARVGVDSTVVVTLALPAASVTR